ncbi:hypothetical protein [Rufibacter tibetensis]|uniref:hypothetical protein n=1 Tax=Rufibacter tibetensis TaxID=512763 RepID=UPI0007822196|nr:hypothetical protein [Rufibacter tibetensis]
MEWRQKPRFIKWVRIAVSALALVVSGCEKPAISTDIPAVGLSQEGQRLKLDSLEERARKLVDKVNDDPKARIGLREVFYRKYGCCRSHKFGFGNSEIAFLKWEARGLLNPMVGKSPGSPWWREVNREFIYYSEWAALVHESKLDTVKALEVPVQVKYWLTFINTPTAKNWYRAHNSSIIASYHKHAGLAAQESYAEKVFINMVLYRVLFAQAMVESERFAFGKLGPFLANPRLPAVDFIVNDPFFYPTTYPLTKKEADIILGRVHRIGALEAKVLDKGLILPHLEELYTHAALINQTPELLSFIDQGKPVYPHKSGE